jgi:hypothetical protein
MEKLHECRSTDITTFSESEAGGVRSYRDCVPSMEQVATGWDTLVRRSRLWRNNWFLHNDHRPRHTSLPVQNKLPTTNLPPYSPDLTPCDFWLCARLKYGVQRSLFWVSKGNSTQRDSRPQCHTGGGFPDVLPVMAGLLEQVCTRICRRVVVRWWIG